jgi:hypothetical protein
MEGIPGSTDLFLNLMTEQEMIFKLWDLGKKVYLNEMHGRDVVIAAFHPRIMRVEFYTCQGAHADSRKHYNTLYTCGSNGFDILDEG